MTDGTAKDHRHRVLSTAVISRERLTETEARVAGNVLSRGARTRPD